MVGDVSKNIKYGGNTADSLKCMYSLNEWTLLIRVLLGG